jgi:hypothetical protein
MRGSRRTGSARSGPEGPPEDHWDTLAVELLGSGRDDPSGLRLRLFEQVASGELLALARAFRRAHPHGALPLPVRLFVADAEVRLGMASLDELVELSAEVTRSGTADERLWCSALIAEHHLWRFQTEALLVAQSASVSASPPESDLGRSALLRLDRINALVPLFDGERDDGSISARFEALGLTEESFATRVLNGLVRTATCGDDEFESDLLLVRDVARSALGMASDRLFFAWYAIGWASLWLDDHDQIVAATDGMRRSLPADSAWFSSLLGIFEALTEAVVGTSEDRVVDTVDDLVRTSRAHFLSLPAFLVHLARLLVDRGLLDSARQVLDAVNLPGLGASNGLRLTFREVTARLAFLDHPSPVALSEMEGVLSGWEALGLTGPRRWAALRFSVDCDRRGLPEAAAAFRAAADDGSPVSDAAGRLLSAEFRAEPDRINLLGPELDVMRRGRRVPIAGHPARLLVLLVLQRRPVTVDSVVDALWPDVDLSTGRQRLKVHLFRLRRALSLRGDELIVRDRHGLRIQPDRRWRIDLWDLEDLLSSGASASGLLSAELDLLEHQFPFDDRLSEARRQLRVRWTASVSAALGRGELDAAAMVRAVERNRISDPDLLYLLAETADQAGDPRAGARLRSAADASA